MEERLSLDRVRVDEFAARAAEVLRREVKGDAEAVLMLNFLKENCGSDEDVREIKPLISFRAYAGEWAVNVKTVLLVAAATWLDAGWTSGVANALLTVSGKTQRAAARLNIESAELCNFITLTAPRSARGARSVEVLAATAGRACRHPKSRCRHRRDEACTIDLASVEGNLRSMLERGVVHASQDGLYKRVM